MATSAPALTPVVNFKNWVSSTSTGWLLSVPLIAILAVILEQLPIGPLQFPVGLGVGIAVGGMQARVLRSVFPDWKKWIWLTLLGISVPFVLTDALRIAGVPMPRHFEPFLLQIWVFLGGACAGVLQARFLRARIAGLRFWVLASILGWSLAGLTPLLAMFLPVRAIAGLLIYLGIVFVGGPVLGLVTGMCFRDAASN